MTPSLASLEEESRELDGSFTQVCSYSLSIYDAFSIGFAWTDPEGGTGGPDPPIGFLSITGPDPLKNRKATKLAFNVRPSSARQRKAI